MNQRGAMGDGVKDDDEALREIASREGAFDQPCVTNTMVAMTKAFALGRASGCEHVKRCYCATTILPTIGGTVATVHAHGAKHTENGCSVERASVSGERDGEDVCVCGHTRANHERGKGCAGGFRLWLQADALKGGGE